MLDKIKISVVFILLVLITTIQASYLSNRFTRPEPVYNEVLKTDVDFNEFKVLLENEYLQVWQKDENLAIKIVDKSNRYIWETIDQDNKSQFNEIWQGIATSILWVEYFDNKAILNNIGSGDKNVVKKYHKVNKSTVRYSINLPTINISLSFEMTLDGKKIRFTLNDSEIKETGDYKIASVTFLPFLGSVYEDEIGGYAFVPDGTGGLIRFSKASHYLAPFEKRVYGKDFGIENTFEINDLKANRPNDFLVKEPDILLPVFGIVHSQAKSAFYGFVKSGSEYSSIVMYPSGILSKYNWGGIKFIYRQRYSQRVSRSGSGVQVAQRERNRFNIEVEYKFLAGDSASYIGIAKEVRNFYNLSSENDVQKSYDIPVAITFVLSDIKKGIFWDSVIKITSVDKILETVKYLKGNGVSNIIVILEGWQKGGANGYRVTKSEFESKVLNGAELSKLLEFSKKENVKLFFSEKFRKLTFKQLNEKTDVGFNLSQAPIIEERDDKSLWFYKTYYLNPILANQLVTKKIDFYKANNITNVLLKDFALSLNSENKYGSQYSRSYVKTDSIKALQKLKKSIENVALISPFDFYWETANLILDMPMNNSQYLFETDTVPFLQILLKGRIPYFTPYMNNSFYSREDILKSIEFGAYPSFILTELDNFELKDTGYTDLLSSKIEDWKDYIVKVYKEMNEALKPFIGKRIFDRKVIEEGFVVVTYENGDSIVVNYTDKVKTFGNHSIVPMNWKVIKKEG